MGVRTTPTFVFGKSFEVLVENFRRKKEKEEEKRKKGRRSSRRKQGEKKNKQENSFQKRNGAAMVAPSPPYPLYCFTLDPLPPIQDLNFYLKGSLVFVSVVGIPEILVIVTRQDGIIYTYGLGLNLMFSNNLGEFQTHHSSPSVHF